MSSNNIDATLNERGARYGEFTDHALYAQDLKRAMQRIPENWHKLSDDKKEALEMVAHKIGRILNGDPEYIDSWHDIIGYVRLVEKNLEASQRVREGGTAQPPVDNVHVAPGCEQFSLRPPHMTFGMPPSAMPDGMSATHYCVVEPAMVRSGYSAECAGCRKVIAGTG